MQRAAHYYLSNLSIAILCLIIPAHAALAQAVGEVGEKSKSSTIKRSSETQESPGTQSAQSSRPVQPAPPAPSSEYSQSAQSAETAKALPEPAKPNENNANEKPAGLPLIVGGEEILRFKTTISGFTPAERVDAIQDRIKKVLSLPDFQPTLKLTDTGYSTDIVCNQTIILTVTDVDARLVGYKNRNVLAQDCADKLTRALAIEKQAHSPKVILLASAYTAASIVILVLVLLIYSALFPMLYRQIDRLRGKYIKALKIQNSELLSEDSLSEIVIGVCRAARAVVTAATLLVFVQRVLSFFPTTRTLSTELVDEAILPVVSAVGSSVAAYSPNLLIIALISVSTYYLITFTHFIFREIGRGKITVNEFDPEWADPTYKIARFLIIAFALVLIFPYLPGSGSPAFQQISIFLGVLISLGSTGAVSNIIAGVFLTYTGAFRIGDRVRIADTQGDVVERKLLYTRIRSIKDEFITVPNSMVLGAHIINYSSSTKHNGLILHTAVTIGYDTPWQKVHELLVKAALKTDGIKQDPPPFVLITSLDNYYVTHEINCYTTSPRTMASIYADLHRSILNEFAAAGVEIMSPQYTAFRQAHGSTVPDTNAVPVPTATSTSASGAANTSDVESESS